MLADLLCNRAYRFDPVSSGNYVGACAIDHPDWGLCRGDAKKTIPHAERTLSRQIGVKE